MNRSKIEELFNSGNHADALQRLADIELSPWRDTTELRCLRALGQADRAKAMAERLYQALIENSAPYALNISEQNHQLRYISLVFAEQGEAQKACEIMRPLCKQSPDLASLHREYAFALTSNDQLDQAEVQLNKALELQPLNANTHSQLARVYCRTGRTEQGFNSYSRAANIEPDNPAYFQRLVYWSNYLERISQQDNYQFARLWANKAFPKNQEVSKTRKPDSPEKKLKIGFVSSDFCANAISFFIIPLLKNLDRKGFDVTAYSDTRKVDGITETIEALCDTWLDSSKLSDTELAAQIGVDQVDILIDLNGHTSGNRLGVFAKHAAPLQISWLGYPSTTGLKSIDYRITDRVADPIGLDENYYSEKLLRIPNSFLCYQPPGSAPKISPTNNNDVIRFGSFNNLAKISGLALDAWAAALHAVPDSTLYLKRQQLINENSKQHFIYEFKRRGIDKSRLILKPSKASIELHLREYNEVDIALDTFPYNGTTTTLESLWMGVPVITLLGDTHAGRVSASILHHVDLSLFVCKNLTEFRERAVQLSKDEGFRSELRETLRSRMKNSSLMNQTQFAGNFGRALRQEWRKCCSETDTLQSTEQDLSEIDVSGVQQ